jgi:hypothetical protein
MLEGYAALSHRARSKIIGWRDFDPVRFFLDEPFRFIEPNRPGPYRVGLYARILSRLALPSLFTTNPPRRVSDRRASSTPVRLHAWHAKPRAELCQRQAPPASAARTGTTGHRASTPGNRIQAPAWIDHCREILKTPETQPSLRRIRCDYRHPLRQYCSIRPGRIRSLV